MIIEKPKSGSKQKIKLGISLLVFIGLIVISLFLFQSQSRTSRDLYLNCGAEKVTEQDGKTMFIEGDHFLHGGQYQSDEQALSGSFSCKLDKTGPYGMTHRLEKLQGGDVVEASVWYFSSGHKGKLIADGDWNFYLAAQTTGKQESGWTELNLEFLVPPHVKNGSIKIYAFNLDENPIYFDNLFIQKRKSNLKLELDRLDAKTSLATLNLNIGEKGMRKLEQKRQSALQKGILQTQDDDWVKAKLETNGASHKAKIRLKGDWTDHLIGDKWSFRVKLASGESWNRMTTFSLQNPQTRYFLYEWVFHKWLQKEGLLAPRYDFIHLKVNGISKGIFAYEEHFEKQLLEYNQRREGPIVKFSEEGFWQMKYKSLQANQAKWADDLAIFESAQIIPFGSKSYLKDSLRMNQLRIAQRLMAAYQRREKSIWETFDVERVAQYYALLDLSKAYHGFIWHNQRLYYNPVTAKLEPIGYDGYTPNGTYEWLDKPLIGHAVSPQSMSSEYHKLLYERFFNDPDFVARYVHYLMRYSDETYLFNLLNGFENEISLREKVLQQEWPEFEHDRQFLTDQAKEVRLTLFPLPEVSIKAYHQSKKGGQARYLMFNYHGFPFQILGIGKSAHDYQALKETPLIPAFTSGYPPHQIEITVPSPAKNVFFQIPGLDSVFQTTVLPWEAPLGPSPEQELFSDLEISSNELYTVLENEKIIRFQPGSHQSKADVVIPAGYTVHFAPGCQLDLVQGAKFISKSPIQAVGSEETPIRIYSSDGKGRGFTLLQAVEPSAFSYVVFEGLTSLAHAGWSHTGAVSVYESEVDFRHCRFLNNASEDGLNIVRSIFSMSDCFLDNCSSDGFDADFCRGTIRNSRFQNTVNDGLDFSGCHIELFEVVIENSGDKAISFGEESTGIVHSATLKSCVIGIASKDLSDVEVEKVEMIDIRQGFAIYQKKPEYGPATISVIDFKEKGLEKLHVIQQGSSLKLGDKLIEGKW